MLVVFWDRKGYRFLARFVLGLIKGLRASARGFFIEGFRWRITKMVKGFFFANPRFDFGRDFCRKMMCAFSLILLILFLVGLL